MKLKQIRDNLEKQGYVKSREEFKMEVLLSLVEEYNKTRKVNEDHKT